MHELTTICFSHFCEKARWALDRHAVPYREHGYMPLLHFPGVALRTGGRGGGRADRASTRFSTPLLETDAGEHIADSSDIVAYVDRRFAGGALESDSEAGALDRDFSDNLAPHTRRVVYHYLLSRPELLHEMARRNVSKRQAAVFRPLSGLISNGIRRGLRVNARGAGRSEEKTRASADAVAERLADGRPFLMGDTFTAADLSFASLFAPAVLPPNYGAWLPPLERMPDGAVRIVEEMRAHPAGQFVLRIYDTERDRVV